MSVAKLVHTFTSDSGAVYPNYLVVVKNRDGTPARLYSAQGRLVDANGVTATDASGVVTAYVPSQRDYKLELRHPLTRASIDEAITSTGVTGESIAAGGGSSGGSSSSDPVVITGDTVLNFASHGNKVLYVDSVTSVVLTIPNDATGGWLQDTSITAYQENVGGISFAAGAGVTLRTAASIFSSEQYGCIGVIRVAANKFARVA